MDPTEIHEAECRYCDHTIGVSQSGTTHKWGKYRSVEFLPKTGDDFIDIQAERTAWMRHIPAVLPPEADEHEVRKLLQRQGAGQSSHDPYGVSFPGYISNGIYYNERCWCGCINPRPKKMFCQTCGRFYARLLVKAHNNRIEYICKECNDRLVPVVLEHEGYVQHYDWKTRGDSND